MLELLPIFFLSIFLAFFSHMVSGYDSVRKTYQRKSYLIFGIMTFSIAVFVGLRTVYNDTSAYIETYNVFISDKGSILDYVLSSTGKIQWLSLGTNPGFTFIQNIMKHLGFSSQDFIMCFALFTIIVYFWFIRKYSSDYFLTVYLFFTFGVFTLCLAAIKQCFAIAVGLIAIDKFLNDKKISFVILILLGALVHPYILIFLAVPLLMFEPWSRKTYYLIGGFAVIGIFFQFFVGKIVDITALLGEDYTADSFNGDGVSPIRAMVFLVPTIVSFFVRKRISAETKNPVNNLMVNLTMLNGLLMFIAMFGNANYFGRLSQYFSIFTIISLPWIISFFDNKLRVLVKVACVVLFFLYLYYQSLYGGDNTFDVSFYKTSLLDYLIELFNF